MKLCVRVYMNICAQVWVCKYACVCVSIYTHIIRVFIVVLLLLLGCCCVFVCSSVCILFARRYSMQIQQESVLSFNKMLFKGITSCIYMHTHAHVKIHTHRHVNTHKHTQSYNKHNIHTRTHTHTKTTHIQPIISHTRIHMTHTPTTTIIVEITIIYY